MAGADFRVVRAIAGKDLRTSLGNPTGYVFLTLFIGITAAIAFLQDAFFARNLADLALLNRIMPGVLMFFVPALTMSAWADERRSGTDELLLTLPVRDVEVVLGKYLGALGMYTVALAFSVVHLVVLVMLGSPDPGLMAATYLGYWLTGALFVAIGLLASILAGNPTVAFVLGALGCGVFVVSSSQAWAAGLLGMSLCAGFAALGWMVVRGEGRGAGIAAGLGAGMAALGWVGGLMRASEAGGEGEEVAFESLFSAFAVEPHVAAFGEGIVRLGDLAFFVGGTVTLLYACSFLLGRRHW
jgi:ABC-2 type transport system permease protein